MGNLIGLASLTAYSLCDALTGVSGVNIAATAFPGSLINNPGGKNDNLATVSPILKHGQTTHRRFQLYPTGSTPLAEALWWVFQEVVPLRESRKIIFIVTDGEPDSMEEARIAVKEGLRFGLEIYGLGLGTDSVQRLLPGRSVVLGKLTDLPKKLFGLFGKTLSFRSSGA
jgi:hypothetical protein